MTAQLTKRIMRRVYAIWFVKKAAPVLILEIPVLLIIAFHETAQEFFVAKIIENCLVVINHGGVAGVLGFMISAIQKAHFVPVLIILFSLGLCGIAAYRLARNFYSFRLVRSY